MDVSNSSEEIIIFVDDADLHRKLISSIQSRISPRLILSLATGAGFARGVTVSSHNEAYHILCLVDHNSQPFTYLTLGAFATQRPISSVIALLGAHSLREDLFPGDLAIVHRASALPYPALYSNKDPYNNQPVRTEHFAAKTETLSSFSEQMAKHHTVLWQRDVPQIHCGYAKHPTLSGDLAPWASEQFAKLRQKGLDTISSATVGVYEAQQLMPKAKIICLNQIRSTPNTDSARQWKRFKSRFHQQAAIFLERLIQSENVASLGRT